MKRDCSELVERLTKHEERAGVTFKGLFAQAEKDDDLWRISIKCEAHSLAGEELAYSVEVVATLLDEQGRVLETSSHYLDQDSFFDFETVDLTFFDVSAIPEKIRIHPKRLS